MAKNKRMTGSAKLKKLSFLIGKWHTVGEMFATDGVESTIIRGMDTYEWISGDQFILHRVDVFMGDQRTEAIELIGYDDKKKSFFLTSYDSTGSVLTMKGSLEGKHGFKLGDKKMRATLSANKDGSMTAHWELNAKKWKPWMKINLTK